MIKNKHEKMIWCLQQFRKKGRTGIKPVLSFVKKKNLLQDNQFEKILFHKNYFDNM